MVATFENLDLMEDHQLLALDLALYRQAAQLTSYHRIPEAGILDASREVLLSEARRRLLAAQPMAVHLALDLASLDDVGLGRLARTLAKVGEGLRAVEHPAAIFMLALRLACEEERLDRGIEVDLGIGADESARAAMERAELERMIAASDPRPEESA